MLKIMLGAAIAAMTLSGAAQAQEMKKCDQATFDMVMKEVEMAPADKKDMAMSELNMAKEKMDANMTDDCSMHLENASKASMGQ